MYSCEPAVVFLCVSPLAPITRHYSLVCFVCASPVITSVRSLYAKDNFTGFLDLALNSANYKWTSQYQSDIAPYREKYSRENFGKSVVSENFTEKAFVEC